jgi:peptidoglycan hydrolase-like protein with peptidoglycan-binding domain
MKKLLVDFQTAVTALGFDAGPADGVWGPRTEAATLSLVAARGFPPARQATVAARGEIRQGSARHLITEVVVHCSATAPTWFGNRTFMEKVAEIRTWHTRDRGWRDIGYHWLVDRDGAVLPGRAETVIGAGVEGRNRGVLHVCLLGGHGSSSTDPFSRNFTAQQDAALRRLIAEIRKKTPISRISGHNEWAAKACPGFSVSRWLAEG